MKPEKPSRIGFQQWANPTGLLASSPKNQEEKPENGIRQQRQPLHQTGDSGSHSTSRLPDHLPSDQLGEQHGQNHIDTGDNRQPSTTVLLPSRGRSSSLRRLHASEVNDESGLNKNRKEPTGFGMRVQSIFRRIPPRKSLIAISLLSLFLVGFALG